MEEKSLVMIKEEKWYKKIIKKILNNKNVRLNFIYNFKPELNFTFKVQKFF